jgi:hypothetical protein
MKGFRRKYYSIHDSPEDFYLHCDTYKNPHSKKFGPIIKKVIKWLPFNLILESQNYPVLDLACGTGEVTIQLMDNNIHHIVGIDPFLATSYSERTSKPVLQNSFEDIYQKRIILERYSIVFCSYALHLCEDLHALLEILKCYTQYLCVLTPHGLPIIPIESGWIRNFDFKYSNVKVYLYEFTDNYLDSSATIVGACECL